MVVVFQVNSWQEYWDITGPISLAFLAFMVCLGIVMGVLKMIIWALEIIERWWPTKWK